MERKLLQLQHNKGEPDKMVQGCRKKSSFRCQVESRVPGENPQGWEIYQQLKLTYEQCDNLWDQTGLHWSKRASVSTTQSARHP